MEHFYLITNDYKDPDYKVTGTIRDMLLEEGKTCILSPKRDENGPHPLDVPEDVDCAIVIGGDGSFIEAARYLYGRHIPMLGINMGSMGYLTEVEVGDVREAIRQILSGSYFTEERLMLTGTFPDGRRNVALNEVVVSRKEAIRPIHFSLYVNGELLNSYESDGIIIATPTGSTAYNLSAGGPIAKPTAELIIATPICSHALNASSILLSGEDEIVIRIGRGKNDTEEEAAVGFDGEDEGVLRTGDELTIRRASMGTTLIRLNDMSFLELLRRKMKGN